MSRLPAPDEPGALTTRLAVALARLSYSVSPAAVPLRTDLPRLLNARGLLGRGVEVGVFLGGFTERMLDEWRGSELVAVDPWRAFGEGVYRDVMDAEQAEHDARYAETLNRLRRFGDRVAVWRETGDEAAARIEDASLDWVYLDAMHDEASVASDLRTWWPKVRPGGIFAGHDYIAGKRGATEFGVRVAVDRFFGELDLQIWSTFIDEPFISWIVEVPDPGVRKRLAWTGRALRFALVAARRVAG
jgi:Methyltransferase domain